MSKPLSWGMPVEKVCEKLKKKDKQICELRYGKTHVLSETYDLITTCHYMPIADKQIDLKNVNLKKLKVRDLKKILNDWDEGCDGCIEKGDYIKRIEELKPKYVKDEL